MKNLELAEIFNEMADILELKNVEWKPRAYRNAASSIKNLTEDIEELAERDELESIPGVGESISEKIKEYLKTGSIEAYEELKEEHDYELHELMQIPSLGPKRSKKLHEELGVKNVSDLEEAAKAGKVRELEGFGEKSEEDILRGIRLYKKREDRMLFFTADKLSQTVIKELKRIGVKKVTITGSLRRMKETIGDVDVLATTSKNREEFMNAFTNWGEVKEVIAHGPTKSTVILKGSNQQVDIRLVDDENWGSALIYFTGNKKHNIEIRKIAMKKGYKLNEYSLSKDGEVIASRTEEGVYEKLGMKWIPPELRTNTGEIKASLNDELPELVKEDDVKGDLHVHTKYSDGGNTIDEMVETAEERGYDYVCISDHSKSEIQARGLNKQELREELKEVKRVDEEHEGIKVLTGCEVDILPDGGLDLSDDVLEELDVVIVAVHSKFKMSEDEMTERVCTAMRNEHVNVLGHPTGRRINEREGYELDWDKVFETALGNNVALEINASPKRLDLNDVSVRNAVKNGVKLVVNTDAHQTDNLHNMKYGIGTARRGWSEKRDLINTLGLKELKKFLNKK